MYSTSSPSTTTHTTSTLSTKLARLNASPTSTMSTLDYYDEVPLFTPSPKLEQQQQQSQQAPPPDCLSASATASVTSSSTFFMDEDSSERSLRAQIESLRQQLAERDLTVNELQRQMQEDKRHHDKLQQRWDLFFSSSCSNTTTTPSSSGMSDSSTRGDRRSNMGRGTSYRSAPYTGKTEDSMKTTTMTALEVQKLNDRMDQLEAEKEAALQKAIKLSVALADTRATVSTLESQLEESQRIIAAQNTSTGILLGFGRRTAPPPPPPPIASKSSHDGKKQKKKSSSRSTSPKPTTKATTTTLPPVDQASSLGDIELNDDDDDDQPKDTTAMHSMQSIVMTTDECHNDATPADDSAPLEIASERGVQSSQHGGGVTTAQPSSERGTTSTGRGWGRFWASSTTLTAATS